MENRKLFDSNRLKRFLKLKGAKEGSKAVTILCSRSFPLYYLIRNLEWLNREAWWKALSTHAKRVVVAKLVRQRFAIFDEVKVWRRNQKPNGAAPGSDPYPQAGELPQNPGLDNLTAPNYCNKCGLCCEVASGMPDFPAPAELPRSWREIFGNGLGPGHRFCPFLWEDNSSGGGLCSIYPLRSNPCRLFDHEECVFFWKTPEPIELSNPRNVLIIGRWLLKLAYPRKLPPVGVGASAKSP